jgi:hypothetical protein
MSTYIDKNGNVIDTTGAVTPLTNAAVQHNTFPQGGPQSNTTVIQNNATAVNISVSGQVLASWANPS